MTHITPYRSEGRISNGITRSEHVTDHGQSVVRFTLDEETDGDKVVSIQIRNVKYLEVC